MIIAAAFLVSAFITTGVYVALRIHAYYLVDGVAKVLEEIERDRRWVEAEMALPADFTQGTKEEQ